MADPPTSSAGARVRELRSFRGRYRELQPAPAADPGLADVAVAS